jgi:DNA gyrase/topoisomerase IV subunit A
VAFEIPTASRQAKGTLIVNLLQVETGEYVTAALNISDSRTTAICSWSRAEAS